MKFMKYLLFMPLVLLLVIVFQAPGAEAISRYGPDQTDFDPNEGDMYFMVSRDGNKNYLNTPFSKLTVYMSYPNAFLSIVNGADGCSGDSGSAPATFTFFNGTEPGKSLIDSYESDLLSCGTSTFREQQPDPSNPDPDLFLWGESIDPVVIGGKTFYPVTIVVEHTGPPGGGGNNAFRVITSNGGYVSYIGYGSYFTIQDRSATPEYSDFYLFFAPQCTMEETTELTLKWEDDDHKGEGGNWNQSNIDRPNEYRMVVEEYKWGEASKSGTNWTSKWYLRGDPAPGETEYEQGGSGLWSGGNYDSSGWTGHGEKGYVTLDFRPGYEYVWSWMQVDTDNGIQFELPKELGAIFSVIDCDTASWIYDPHFRDPSGATPAGSAVSPGDVIRVVGRVTNDGDGKGPIFNQRIRASKNAAYVYQEGVLDSGYWDGKIARWDNQSGLNGSASNTNKRVDYKVSSSAVPGSDVCFRVGVTPTSGDSEPSITIDDSGWEESEERCFVVADAGQNNWNYDPRFITPPTTSTATKLKEGDTLVVTGDIRNKLSGKGVEGGIQINLTTGSDHAEPTSTSGDYSSHPSDDAYIWTPEDALGGGNNSTNRTVSYKLNDDIPSSVTQICATVSVWPNAGTSLPTPVATDDTWDVDTQCWDLDTSKEYYNHDPTIDIPGEIERDTAFSATATVTNVATAGETTGPQSYSTSTFVSKGGSNITGSSSASPGNWALLVDDYSWANRPGLPEGATATFTSDYTVNRSAILGRDNVCFKSDVSPDRGIIGETPDSNLQEAGPDCADVFDKFLHIIGAPTGNVVPGQEVEFNITNDGNGPGANDTADGEVTEYRVTGPFGLDTGWQRINPAIGAKRSVTRTFKIPDTVEIGEFCGTIRVNPESGKVYANNGSDVEIIDPTVSVPFCLTINEQPYLEVHGADVWAGGIFASDVNNPFVCHGDKSKNAIIRSVNNGTIGSFAEFAVTATGDGSANYGIFSFGSNNSVLDDELTFANTLDPLGNFSRNGRCIPHYFNLLRDSDGTVFYNSNRTINNAGSSTTVAVGKKTIILVDGVATINDDIRYANYSVNDTDDVPFFMLVATEGINIVGSVDRLDGLYVSLKNINTCSDQPADITVDSVCDNTLLINGAFISDKTNFDRAAGGLVGHNGYDGPAEEFKFSPELFLGAPSAINQYLGDFETEQFRDLPPVYSDLP